MVSPHGCLQDTHLNVLQDLDSGPGKTPDKALKNWVGFGAPRAQIGLSQYGHY